MFIKTLYFLSCLSLQLISTSVASSELDLEKRLNLLEKKVAQLEQVLASKDDKNRWKDTVLWTRVKKDMSEREIKELIGSPTRVEDAIFTTWYYHRTSKLHSYIWFDEGKVLGWKTPE